MPAKYKPVDPTKRLRDLRKDFKDMQQGTFEAPEGTDVATALADFVRRAHRERQLNMVMHAAAMCLEQDPDPPSALVAAYTGDVDGAEERLRNVAELANVARWIGSEELKRVAEDLAREQAPVWVADAAAAERRRRLRDLGSMFDRAFADDIRDQVGD